MIMPKAIGFRHFCLPLCIKCTKAVHKKFNSLSCIGIHCKLLAYNIIFVITIDTFFTSHRMMYDI